MARENGKDYVYLIWKEPISRRQYTIAKLSKNGKYEFEYDFEINDAIKKGFEPLIAFPDITKKYTNNKLFTSFSSRIPDRRRKNIDEILNKYGLNEYNEYEILKRSGGRLPIDNFEFIDPIIINEENPIEREFYIAGPRHYLGCDSNQYKKSLNVSIGEKLSLTLHPENQYDSNAIKINKLDNTLLGYIPRYYNKELLGLLNLNWKYELSIIEINKNNNCNECLKVRLKLMN